MASGRQKGRPAITVARQQLLCFIARPTPPGSASPAMLMSTPPTLWRRGTPGLRSVTTAPPLPLSRSARLMASLYAPLATLIRTRPSDLPPTPAGLYRASPVAPLRSISLHHGASTSLRRSSIRVSQAI